MTREEMILQAKETRKRVTNAPVSEAELARFPVSLEKTDIPVRDGRVTAYISRISEGREYNGKRPVIVNLHGGGFIRERTPNDELFCRRMTHAVGCMVVDVDYKIAPDYPYPTALYESYDAVKWVRDNAQELNVSADRIILTGHSAGGNLICGINMLMAADDESGIFANVIEYPPLDLYTDPDDKPQNGKAIPAERAKLYNLYYCDRERQREPLASPVFAPAEMLGGFAPTMVITAGLDSLCNEGEQFALHLAQAGVETTLVRFPQEDHAFTIYRRGDWEKANELIFGYIKRRLLV